MQFEIRYLSYTLTAGAIQNLCTYISMLIYTYTLVMKWNNLENLDLHFVP